MLDADEELPLLSRELLQKEMRASQVMAYRLPIVDAGKSENGCNYVPRLFRNAPGIYFTGRIHEHAFGSVESKRKDWGLENRLSEATLVHYGYTEEMTRRREKVSRNHRLLQLAVEEQPGDPNLLMNLGLELVRSDRRDEGLEPAGIRAAKRRSGPVLGSHQADQQELAARKDVARTQARARAFERIGVLAADDNALVEIEPTIQDDHRGHELGDRGDRGHCVGVFINDDLAGVGIQHQRGRRPQVDGLMSLGFARLGEADCERKDEKEGEDSDDSLERVEFPLHCG
jgi:hypothetical protein